MKRIGINQSIVAAVVLAMGLTIGSLPASAHKKTHGSGGSSPQIVKFYPIGNGQGFDDKVTGHCDTTTYPNLTCFNPNPMVPADADFCGCLYVDPTTPAPFSGSGLCHGSTITVLQISFDFTNASGVFNGLPNGTITDSTPPPLSGRCYGASGLATITTADGATPPDTINLLLQGLVCDTIPGQPANNASFTGSYIITGGTGPYASAIGTGSFTTSIDNVNTFSSGKSSPMTFSATGSLTALSGVTGSSCSGLDGCSEDGGDADANGDCHSNDHNGHGED